MCPARIGDKYVGLILCHRAGAACPPDQTDSEVANMKMTATLASRRRPATPPSVAPKPARRGSRSTPTGKCTLHCTLQCMQLMGGWGRGWVDAIWGLGNNNRRHKKNDLLKLNLTCSFIILLVIQLHQLIRYSAVWFIILSHCALVQHYCA